jgi:hypothetical protein
MFNCTHSVPRHTTFSKCISIQQYKYSIINSTRIHEPKTIWVLRQRWPKTPEDGTKCSETCQGNNTITIFVKLTRTCWKTKMYVLKMFIRTFLNTPEIHTRNNTTLFYHQSTAVFKTNNIIVKPKNCYFFSPQASTSQCFPGRLQNIASPVSRQRTGILQHGDRAGLGLFLSVTVGYWLTDWLTDRQWFEIKTDKLLRRVDQLEK